MSTSYYPLREPITSIWLKKLGPYTELLVWLGHEIAGRILCRDEDEARALLRALATDHAAATVYATANGPKLAILSSGIQSDAVLVSERGELTTLQELKATCL